DAIELAAMHLAAAGELHFDAREGDDQHAADIKEEPVEAAPQFGIGAVHVAEDEDQGAQMHSDNAGGENHVRRGEDFDVEAIGIVPPVVKWRGREHGDATPGSNERAERSAEAPDFDGSLTQRRAAAERGGEYEVRAGDAGEDAAQVNANVCRRPEAVTPDRA